MSANLGVSHLTVSEDRNQINLAWMDDDLFGAVQTDGADKWAYEFSDLWDVGYNEDGTVTAAVSNPSEGPGGLGYGVEGEVQWNADFDNAAGWYVSVSDSGDYVAVGLDRYWEGIDTTGSPGVALYDDRGDRLWKHETEEAVLTAEVHENREVVVAGTDDGKILRFDLQGDLLWEKEEDGGE
jgi:hypothetical protein